MPDAKVRVAGRAEPLWVRLEGEDRNFILDRDPIEATALRELDPVHADLLAIAATIFAADGAVPRGGKTRPHMGVRWSRQFDFEIPVRRPDHWSRPDVTAALVEAVEFLTEDSVTFQFVPYGPEPRMQSFLNLHPGKSSFEADEVVLFSGGLDSFSGALETLLTTRSRVILVTHRSAQKAITRQVDLGRYLAGRFKGRVLHIHVVGRRSGSYATDWNQRSRSLLFAALGQAVARAFEAKRVSLFENGVVSHNLPVSDLIVGAMASRTTHPFALQNLDRLMRAATPDAVPIENRYQWLTKTDVVSRIRQNGASEQVSLAVSCTSIREQERIRNHCGACTQCLDRRFAILAAGLQKYDPENSYQTDVLFGERREERSRILAVEWTRHMRLLGELDEDSLLREFGIETSRILRGHPETEAPTALDMMLTMYRRQSENVQSVLEKAVHERAADLVTEKLPSSSLIRLHVGRSLELPEVHHPTGVLADPIEVVDEVDAVPDADAPLRVEFSIEGGRLVVDVIGISTLKGGMARVPHALKPAFDEDRRDSLPPRDHRYMIAVSLPMLANMSKGAIRKSVQRCRKTLAQDFERVHGVFPEKYLLIQSKSSKGYRLDPEIEVLDSERR